MTVIIFAVVSLSKSLPLVCSFQNNNWIVVRNQYTCFNPVITSEVNLTNGLNITGVHLSGKNYVDVRGFYALNWPQLSRIPNGITVFFPHLLAFRWLNGYRAQTSSLTILNLFLICRNSGSIIPN